MTHPRAERLQVALQEELADLIRREVKDPRLDAAGLCTIHAVRLSSDLSGARIYVTFVGGDTETGMAALARAAGFLSGAVTRRLHLRRAPALRFILDDTDARAAHIEALLRGDGGGQGGSGRGS